MKKDTHDREKQLAALEHNQRQAQTRDDLQATKDQDFYARLGLSGPDTSTLEDAYIISIHCERWTLPDLEAAGDSTRDIELDHVTLDADDLVRHSRDYGISEPSSTDPRMTPNIWFRSAYPREDHAYFEQGVEKYYSLHIHEVNGHPPGPAEYQRVADLVGVRFDQAVLQQEQGLEQEGPNLCS